MEQFLWNHSKVRSVWQTDKSHQKITTNNKKHTTGKYNHKTGEPLSCFYHTRMEELKSPLYPCKLWSGTTELWKRGNCTRFFKLLTYYYWMFQASHSRQDCSARLWFSPKRAVHTSQLKEKGKELFLWIQPSASCSWRPLYFQSLSRRPHH